MWWLCGSSWPTREWGQLLTTSWWTWPSQRPPWLHSILWWTSPTQSTMSGTMACSTANSTTSSPLLLSLPVFTPWRLWPSIGELDLCGKREKVSLKEDSIAMELQGGIVHGSRWRLTTCTTGFVLTASRVSCWWGILILSDAFLFYLSFLFYSFPFFSFPLHVHMCVQSLSCVRLFATPWIVARQAPLSMGFSRQEYWSGLPFSSPVHCSHIGSELASPALAGRFFTTEPPGNIPPPFFSSFNSFFPLLHSSPWHFSFQLLLCFFPYIPSVFCLYSLKGIPRV